MNVRIAIYRSATLGETVKISQFTITGASGNMANHEVKAATGMRRKHYGTVLVEHVPNDCTRK